MIVTIANPKGGTGKTTLVRALSGTAAHAGNDVFLIDADSRANRGRNKSSAKSYAKVERTVNPRREPA